MKMGFRDIMFWMFLIFTIVLLLWYMFGDSPTEIFISSGIAGIVFLKMWDLSEKQIKLEMGTRNGFNLMKKDLSLIKERLDI